MTDEAVWDGYVLGSASGYFVALVASQLVERTERGDDMFVAMASRHAHQIRTVGLLDVLGVDVGVGGARLVIHAFDDYPIHQTPAAAAARRHRFAERVRPLLLQRLPRRPAPTATTCSSPSPSASIRTRV